MQQNKISILSTRAIDGSLINHAKKLNIEVDVLSFIEIKTIDTTEVRKEIENALLRSSAVVFTSMNAVEVVANNLNSQQPDWRIYSIGHTTSNLVIKYFGEEAITGIADSASELGKLIVAKGEDDGVIFFCGDQRRDELPEFLRNHDIDMNEIVVYETVAVPHKVDKQYHGILFFSPSTVESFFSSNKIAASTVLFAIGNTTANALRKHGNNEIIISNEPGKDKLFRKMMEYFAWMGSEYLTIHH
ncbi:MAG TPA: uroporphyrinogen-III synthase [Chitinophagaceae bacterium]|nr:uroporphyrinogen-III synthase [Chitinophagaceae bacterium]